MNGKAENSALPCNCGRVKLLRPRSEFPENLPQKLIKLRRWRGRRAVKLFIGNPGNGADNKEIRAD